MQQLLAAGWATSDMNAGLDLESLQAQHQRRQQLNGLRVWVARTRDVNHARATLAEATRRGHRMLQQQASATWLEHAKAR
eukprot:6939024-Prymnesium_polylepis.1